MAVPFLDFMLNDIPFVIVWTPVAAVLSLVLYRAYWSEQRGLQAVAAAKGQPDTFLVLSVESTCVPGTGFDWPNEIIVGTSG